MLLYQTDTCGQVWLPQIWILPLHADTLHLHMMLEAGGARELPLAMRTSCMWSLT